MVVLHNGFENLKLGNHTSEKHAVTQKKKHTQKKKKITKKPYVGVKQQQQTKPYI